MMSSPPLCFYKPFWERENFQFTDSLIETVATGYSEDVTKFAERFKTSQNAIELLRKLLSDYHGVSAVDRLRFVMLVVAQHGCLSGSTLDELINLAELGNAERDVIKRMANVGVTSDGMKGRNSTYHEARKTYCKEQAKKGSGERYAPLIKYFLEKDTVNQKARAIRTRREARLKVEYDIICKMDFDAPDEASRTVRLENFKDAWQNLDGDGKYTVKQITRSFNKLQSGGVISWEKFRDTMLQEWEKPTGNHIPIAALNQREHRTKKRWGSKGREAARKEEEESPWILFFLGGVSFNEISQIRHFAERENRNVYIGATEILSARTYMDKFIQSNSTN